MPNSSTKWRNIPRTSYEQEFYVTTGCTSPLVCKNQTSDNYRPKLQKIKYISYEMAILRVLLHKITVEITKQMVSTNTKQLSLLAQWDFMILQRNHKRKWSPFAQPSSPRKNCDSTKSHFIQHEDFVITNFKTKWRNFHIIFITCKVQY